MRPRHAACQYPERGGARASARHRGARCAASSYGALHSFRCALVAVCRAVRSRARANPRRIERLARGVRWPLTCARRPDDPIDGMASGAYHRHPDPVVPVYWLADEIAPSVNAIRPRAPFAALEFALDQLTRSDTAGEPRVTKSGGGSSRASRQSSHATRRRSRTPAGSTRSPRRSRRREAALALAPSLGRRVVGMDPEDPGGRSNWERDGILDPCRDAGRVALLVTATTHDHLQRADTTDPAGVAQPA